MKLVRTARNVEPGNRALNGCFSAAADPRPLPRRIAAAFSRIAADKALSPCPERSLATPTDRGPEYGNPLPPWHPIVRRSQVRVPCRGLRRRPCDRRLLGREDQTS